MDGIKKTALLLSGLEWKTVDTLLGKLDPDSAKAVRKAMITLDNNSMAVSHRLASEFLAHFGTEQKISRANLQSRGGREMVGGYINPPYRNVIPRKPFAFFDALSPQTIASALENEHPQTIAIVLMHLSKLKQRSVCDTFSPELKRAVLERIPSDCDTDMDDEILYEIEAALKDRVTEMSVSSLDRLEKLSNSELSTLFRNIDADTALLALIGAKPSLIERVTKRLTPTEEYQMRKRLANLKNISEEDIFRARQKLLKIVVNG